MAKEYFEKLSILIKELNLKNEIRLPIEVKHFFSGAAFYVDGSMCASWSPGGLAFKLPENEVIELINKGDAKPLKYFPKGNVKKGYALFESPDKHQSGHWRPYFIKASQQI